MEEEGMAYRRLLRSIFDAALAAVAPDGALERHLRVEGDTLHVDAASFPLANRRIYVLGAGKGAAPMAQAVENMLGDRITGGHVVVKYEHDLPLRHMTLWEAAHPVPDAAGERAAAAMLRLAAATKAGDLVLCLLTGGASALTPAPVADVTLQDMQAVTMLLLGCGASIDEINTLRKHVSRFSGGQLARALAPAEVCSLIISDVPGDNLEVIASGPTTPDSGTFARCMSIIHKYNLFKSLPDCVLQHIQHGLVGMAAETPKAGDPCFRKVHNVLAATNHQALEAAAACALHAGYIPHILTDTLTGEAREQGKNLARRALDMADMMRPDDAPVCLLAGGETTVTLRGGGKGGRNQEMALSAALELQDDPRVACLFAGTDGTDGPTDAAGGYALAGSAARLLQACNPYSLLERNDSYTALECAGDLLKTGPTRTNVMDISILLVHPRTV